MAFFTARLSSAFALEAPSGSYGSTTSLRPVKRYCCAPPLKVAENTHISRPSSLMNLEGMVQAYPPCLSPVHG